MPHRYQPFLILLAVAGPLSASGGDEWIYESRALGQWSVQVESRLVIDRPKLAAKALALLEEKLTEADRLLPPDKLAFLRERPIWLSLENGPGAAYHPSRKWLENHGFNPAMAECVEIKNADNFLAWSGHQPMMIIHELAHAFHHRRHDFGHEELRKAYRAAQASGRYDRVLYWNGSEKPAYALNNHKEYFAELTEAYFGRNDIFPFTRAELRHHDPAGHARIAEIWYQPLDSAPGNTGELRPSSLGGD